MSKNPSFKKSDKKPSGSAGQSGKKVILVTYPDDFIQEEAKGLVEAAGYQLVEVFTQRSLSNQQYGVGAGKAEEIRNAAEEKKTQMIIIDERLSSSQAHNLAKFSHQEVIDRERLILDIFNSRASTTEAKLQVKLAELRYEIPRAREAVRISLKGEQAGFMGMGEYAVDIKFRALKRQMALVQKKLEDARKRRQLFLTSRGRLNLPFVSLAGYTSSGKTTLFNRFVSETKEESQNLFTTLTTTTRGFEPLEGKKVLLSDTVGFISRLPTYMVEAFKSTLEELSYADLILLMIDASEPLESIQIKYHSCREVLEQLHINPVKLLVVLNKIDLIQKDQLKEKLPVFGDLSTIGISAKTGEGTKKLRIRIAQRVYGEEDVSGGTDQTVSEELEQKESIDRRSA
ncbi:MAG: GTPase HflX [Nitrososphaerota archaeon]|nr:GTPase HflX [Nitrososphaerota archaeon]